MQGIRSSGQIGVKAKSLCAHLNPLLVISFQLIRVLVFIRLVEIQSGKFEFEMTVGPLECNFSQPLDRNIELHWFADLREGRRAVRQWASGRRVLNLFSYAGGFSLRAALSGGAALSPDISRVFVGLGLCVLQGYGLTETSPVACANSPERISSTRWGGAQSAPRNRLPT